ncbi:MAG: DUF2141 domain-containing protein [Spirochaetaceae bacterium]|nr:DUF2141 domain-containing protein [Spirochaetaceae bacterium]MDT8299683.1 DUF2141 domain-containing protein [Spirochaetaceae bacterium]
MKKSNRRPRRFGQLPWRHIFPAVLTFLIALPAGSLELRFRVSGIEVESGGRILAGLYASEEGFPEAGYEVGGVIIDVSGETVEGVFTELPPGRYVVAVVHDTDGDGTMTTGFMGIPKEGYGFSGVEEAPLKPPKFNKAAVELRDDGVVVVVPLRYM